MEKILKTLETIKVPTLSGSDANIPGTIISAVVAASDSVKTKKKERISHCRSVTDAICMSSVQSLSDYHQILESVVEVLFQLSSDPDSDIRLVASECLCRLVRTLNASQQPKLQMEIYKEIRRNQNAKSLRTALQIFAYSSHLIKAQKCRAFFASLLPCFVQISRRTEEYLYEPLASYFSQIFASLGPFATESEVKLLCKEYLVNLTSSSAIIRRASASILVSICENAKSPHKFLSKLLLQVTSLLKPNMMECPVPSIIGAIQCIRHIIPPLYRTSSTPSDPLVLQLVQVYEMTLILCNHDDHNVITTSLETLQQLLTDPPEPLRAALSSPLGIENSIDPTSVSLSPGNRIQTPPESDIESLQFPDESPELLETDSDIPKFRSFLSSSTSDNRDLESEDIVILSRANSESLTLEETQTDNDSNPEILHHSDPEDDQPHSKTVGVVLPSFPELQIGSLYEHSPAVFYCARFLAYNFLLAGQSGYTRPDAEVRISVKVLAINCLANLVKLCVPVYSLPLSPSEDAVNVQRIEEICLYASHSDPLLRGCTYILAGYVLQALVPSEKEQILNLTQILKQGLFDSSNIGVKCALAGVSSCLERLWTSSDTHIASNLFTACLAVSANPYWLVKADLIELLATVNWSRAVQNENRKQEILNILLDYLQDEDPRVRSSAVLCLPRFINGVSCKSGWSVASSGVLCPQCILKDINFKLDIGRGPKVCSFCNSSGESVASTVEHVLQKLVQPTLATDNKHLFSGYQAAIAHLSETHPPSQFVTAWRLRTRISDSGMLLSLYMDLLRTSPYVYDMAVHQSLLKVASNLFLASEFFDRAAAKGKSFEEGNPFLSNNSSISIHGAGLIQHLLAVLKLYQTVIETASASSSRKVSTSPVISPVKKFSQKLEAEKKAAEADPDKKAKGPYFSTPLCPVHMRKINDGIVQSWRVYRCSLDGVVAAKFTGLLTACLDVLGNLFSVVRSDYPAMTFLIEDILGVTTAILSGGAPREALTCIRRVLQSVFSGYKVDKEEILALKECPPRDRFPKFLFPNQLLRFNEEKSVPVARSSAEVTALAAFIRQFEPAVVSGLRIYTTTSSTLVQIEVLRLLKQLISGHVNYGLVDSNQVFLSFVIKQITYLEEGLIRDGALLVEEMFQFLALLSHEHHATKSFVDVPKVLNLCDILISSQYGCESGARSLMPVVIDIVVKRSRGDSSNWERKESSNQAEALLQLILKAVRFPEVLKNLWIFIAGRQIRQETRWSQDSSQIFSKVLTEIQCGSLVIRERGDLNCLVAALCGLSKEALPQVEELVTILQKLLSEDVSSRSRWNGWVNSVISYWVLIVKLSVNSDNSLGSDIFSGQMVINMLIQLVSSYIRVEGGGCGGGDDDKLFVCQFGTLVYSLLFLLQSEVFEDLKLELHGDICAHQWMTLSDKLRSLPGQDLALRTICIDLLSAMAYPNADMFEEYLLSGSSDQSTDFLTAALTQIMSDLNDGDIPGVEEWMITTHAQDVISMLHQPTTTTFLSRLSKFRKGQFLGELEKIIGQPALPESLQENILHYLNLASDDLLSESAILGLSLLHNQLQSPHLTLSISQFVCSALSQIHTRQLLFTHKDRDVIKAFLGLPTTSIRYPRLFHLATGLLGDSSPDHISSSSLSSMISSWSCEEMTSLEGLALAKMFSSLKFTQIMNIFSQRDFNLRLLQYCFMSLRNLHQMEVLSSIEIISLFSSESRSSLMEKCPLGVACVEFVLETLDTWENIVDIEVIEDLDKLSDWSFLHMLPAMWESLTEMLRLKKAVIKTSVPEEKAFCNNFIPTKIFTVSFQFILMDGWREQSPVQRLRTFLNFAKEAFGDPSFVSFFNVRDSPQHVFLCVRSLRKLVEKIVEVYKVDWNYTGGNEDYYKEIDEECAGILADFDYLMDFVFNVRRRRVQLDESIGEPLWNVISGLGRCELINGWILISHLRWKPQASWKSQIFPPIEPIPLEILRSDHDLLLQYIFKLNVFGVASKIQFEENWVIFLSVINLYVDESFQLQIVSAGLKALSMLLQQCVSIHYIDKPLNEEIHRLVGKIDETLEDVEPCLCKQISFPALITTAAKSISNPHGIDVNSCIRFLTDLYTQWLQNPQGKMPLLLLSEVVRSIVVLSEYFEEASQFQWMYETLLEVHKSFEKEDEVLWSHLIYGIFYSAAKIQLEPDQLTNLVQILDGSISSPCPNVALTGLKCALTFLQNHPDSAPVLAVVVPYVLRLTQLDETSKDAEVHTYEVWKLLLFTWIHGPQDGFGVVDFEQDTLRNILTILSPINKTFVSVRLLVLKALRKKVLSTELRSDVRKKITKVAFETLSTPNMSIFVEALKLYTTIFYVDFYEFRNLPDPDPEVLMPMAERTEILFHLLKSGNKCSNQSVSKILSLLILVFLPPSEILNRVIAEFMSPTQSAPELLAPVVAQVFEKARRKPKEAALVREWILAGLPNFLNSADMARIMWSLTIFFIGVSSSPEVANLLPFACLRRRTPQIQQLFIHSAVDLYGTLDEVRSKEFRSTLLRNVDVGKDSSPLGYLTDLLNKRDEEKKFWRMDSSSSQ